MAKTTKVKGNKKEAKASKQTKEEKAAAVSSSSASSSSSSSSESESDSSSSSSDSESETETKKETKDASSSESSSDEEESKKEESKESSSSDSSSDEEEESNDKKRKSVDAEEEEEEEEEESNKKQKNEESQEPATIFVGRLSWSIDDEWLKKEFEPVGGVISARVIYERGTDRSRGYGYVDFENQSYAEKAIKEMQGKEIDGRPINCDISTSKPAGNNNNNDRAKKFGDTPSEPSDTLFLGNLSFNADRDTIFEMFAKHGEVVSVRIPTHPETEQPKGFGYVQYSSLDDAKKALDALQGEYIDNRPVRLDYSSPRPNNDGGRGGSRGFGGRGGGRGGNRGFGGSRGGSRGGARGGRGGFRPSGSGANTAPLGRSRNTASFAGSKKTFD
ncbi:hypothetical protein SEUBUCD650_0G04110 [Saccharomyces eubayanus]|uniref:RRM domain-containing protein n=1 Tax=Saccharomyces eubayanus TaxID=1080349 RepID=A0ABN8VWC9_SACEU|nr:hypothetical protein SEUBUCD650_0G04110 [Saccharomyces eubayanus]